MKIDSGIGDKKADVQKYFRNRASEILKDLSDKLGRNQYKKITQALQPAIRESRDSLVRTINHTAQRESWDDESTLCAILLVNHISNSVMLEFRHKVWPYEYMAFSRRIGELWESFVSICFHYPLSKKIILEVPPLFSDVRNNLETELTTYIDSLSLDETQRDELRSYYEKVWLLVDAGEIKLELDMHFLKDSQHFNVDFKSGFSSNEKGNTNRLLVVASIYANIIDADYRNLILVRAPEEENNNYLQTIKNSGLWEVSCGPEAYKKISELVEFDLPDWIDKNIVWKEDLDESFLSDLDDADLMKYLNW